jgi:hypothetical protein
MPHTQVPRHIHAIVRRQDPIFPHLRLLGSTTARCARDICTGLDMTLLTREHVGSADLYSSQWFREAILHLPHPKKASQVVMACLQGTRACRCTGVTFSGAQHPPNLHRMPARVVNCLAQSMTHASSAKHSPVAPCLRKGSGNVSNPTACRVMAREVEQMRGLPSSGSAEVAVGPAKGLRAIVIGTGMAGLAAARIMADHFDEVSIRTCPFTADKGPEPALHIEPLQDHARPSPASTLSNYRESESYAAYCSDCSVGKGMGSEAARTGSA